MSLTSKLESYPILSLKKNFYMLLRKNIRLSKTLDIILSAKKRDHIIDTILNGVTYPCVPSNLAIHYNIAVLYYITIYFGPF